MRLLSYNMHKGFSPSNRRFELANMREAIRQSGAQIVCLQELRGLDLSPNAQRDADQEQQLEYMADSLWPHYSYSKNAVYPEGHHGNAILSQVPIVKSYDLDLSCMKGSYRSALHVTLANDIHIVCAHLGLLAWERKQQQRRLAEYIAQQIPADATLLLAGDFNDWRFSTHRYLKHCLALNECFEQTQGKLAKSFPSFYPLLAVDRIYYRNCEPVSAIACRGKPWSSLSDHCALSADFSTPSCEIDFI